MRPAGTTPRRGTRLSSDALIWSSGLAHLRPRRRLRRRGLPPGRHSQPRRSLLPGLAQRRPARLRSRSRSLARSRGGSATPRLAPLRVVTVPSCARARRCLAPAFAFANAASGAVLRGGFAAPAFTLPTLTLNRVVPMIDTDSPFHSMKPGASLRDRATLPSPLRGLGPAGGYPSRLRSLRSLRAPLARWLASLAFAGVRIRERHLAPAATCLLRSRATAARPRFRSRNRFPLRSVPWVRSFLRPSAARLSHPTQRAARTATSRHRYAGPTLFYA